MLYAGRGWQVLPLYSIENGACTCRKGGGCNSPGKHPRCRKGVHAATTDPATIQQWWNRWPNANIGVATGDVSGIDVIDIDRRNGGDDSLRELELKHGDLPVTPLSITGGGYHYLFHHDPSVSANREIAEGIDLRTTNGYFVAPPSLHKSGTRYTWDGAFQVEEVAVAEFPDWLLSLICDRKNRSGRNRSWSAQQHADKLCGRPAENRSRCNRDRSRAATDESTTMRPATSTAGSAGHRSERRAVPYRDSGIPWQGEGFRPTRLQVRFLGNSGRSSVRDRPSSGRILDAAVSC